MKEPTVIRPRKVIDGLPEYIPGMPIWEVKKAYGLDRVIKLASNENPLGPSPAALEAIRDTLPELHRYPDVRADELRRRLAQKLELHPDQLILTNGVDELITLLSEAFLEEGDEVVMTEPSYSEYSFGAQLMGASIVRVPLGRGFAFDTDALLGAVTPRTKLMYLCSPNNPTGTYISRTELEHLLNRLPGDVLVVLDGAYSHYATASDYSDGRPFIRENYPVLLTQTFSKIYGLAGLRIGVGAAPASIIRSIRKVKEPFNVNLLAQAAACAALTDEEHLQASLRLVVEGRAYLYKAFEALGIMYTPSMANFVLASFGPNAEAVYSHLLQQGIILRYGGQWGLPEHIRITVGTVEENQLLIEALTRWLHP